uniref:hypothetical protein n=1 Tax=uncultured Rhizobium sp. TaxID=155567 RepID=UPI002636C29A|nr:hypothetical protein [uncultured Rhizobium sp.]
MMMFGSGALGGGMGRRLLNLNRNCKHFIRHIEARNQILSFGAQAIPSTRENGGTSSVT